MTSFLKLQAVAAARGDGLHARLLAHVEGAVSAPQSSPVSRIDGMIQSGPDPLKEKPGYTQSQSVLRLRGAPHAADDATSDTQRGSDPR
jgi:hypothetical protein